MAGGVRLDRAVPPPLLVRTVRSTVRLEAGREYRIGRDDQADIPLIDVRVSWEHAVLRAEGPVWVLEDRGSRNGTFLGYELIRRLEINGPYTVHLGHPEHGPVLRLELMQAPAGSPAGMTAGPSSDDTTFMPSRRAYPASEHPSPPAGAPGGPGHGVSGPAGPGSQDGGAGATEPEPGRYLHGHCPDRVRPGEAFAVLAGIVRDPAGNVALRPFSVGIDGRDVVLVLHAPGFQVLGSHRQLIRVPYTGDSDPVMFELRADSPGPQRISVTAWAGGTYLGELILNVAVARYRIRRSGHRDTAAVIGTSADRGAVSLVVRYDPAGNAYRFEFRDDDNPQEVMSQLAYEPGPRVEAMLGGLERLARGRDGYSPAEARDYLVNVGAGLWGELIPAQLRDQFWERRDRIRQLTILTDRDTVPWELLYPLDRGHDAGFLVEQFPVTRLVFGHRPARSLSLAPPWFVLPDGSPAQARDEVAALLRLLGYDRAAADPVISALTPLLDLIRSGDFGLLHFACHNAFDPAAGPSITLNRREFTPLQLNTAAIGQVLERSSPTVFINACRSAATAPAYRQLDGWAGKFLEAGAGAFIGSLWAVRDSTARDFAGELYRHLLAGTPLGHAAMLARQAAAGTPGDPTWLAYAVYGDPRATLRLP